MVEGGKSSNIVPGSFPPNVCGNESENHAIVLQSIKGVFKGVVTPIHAVL